MASCRKWRPAAPCARRYGSGAGTTTSPQPPTTSHGERSSPSDLRLKHQPQVRLWLEIDPQRHRLRGSLFDPQSEFGFLPARFAPDFASPTTSPQPPTTSHGERSSPSDLRLKHQPQVRLWLEIDPQRHRLRIDFQPKSY